MPLVYENTKLDKIEDVLSEPSYPDEEKILIIAESFEDKNGDGIPLDDILNLIKEYETTSKARKEAAAELIKSSEASHNAAILIKQCLRSHMENRNLTMIKGKIRAAKIVSNGGVLPLMFEDEFSISELPEDFVVTEQKPNNALLRQSLENGDNIPNVRLGERGKHIRVI